MIHGWVQFIDNFYRLDLDTYGGNILYVVENKYKIREEEKWIEGRVLCNTSMHLLT